MKFQVIAGAFAGRYSYVVSGACSLRVGYHASVRGFSGCWKLFLEFSILRWRSVPRERFLLRPVGRPLVRCSADFRYLHGSGAVFCHAGSTPNMFLPWLCEGSVREGFALTMSERIGLATAQRPTFIPAGGTAYLHDRIWHA